MKMRNGFVSNSSSSSFIIGVGRVKEGKEQEFKKWFSEYFKRNGFGENNSWHANDAKIKSTIDILQGNSDNDWDCWTEVKNNDGKLIVTAEVNSEPTVSIKFDRGGDSDYFVVRVGNDEGDCSFSSVDGYDLDYDKVDNDWFVGYQKELLDVLQGKGDFFEDVTHKIGAARNG